MYRLPSIRLPHMLLGLAVLLCLTPSSAFAQAPAPHGFFYPVATLKTVTTFLETGCEGYVSDHYHLGWDLAQPRPDQVYAITDGTVSTNPDAIYPLPGQTDPTGGDDTWIWVQHQAVDPSTGKTFTFYAVYGHTTPISGLKPGSPVRAGQIIGTTITYLGNDANDHCHLGINLSGIVIQVKNYSLTYVNGSGQTTTTSIQAGWGRGTLPTDWCSHEGQNKPLLQANSAALENFTDPQAFLNTYYAVGFGGNSTNIYVSTSGSDSNNGSSGSPLRTVAHAIAQASSTQSVTINIASGTYGEKVSASKHILFVTWGSGTVRIGG